jgi:prolipoprotein diacylglyceryl transferase
VIAAYIPSPSTNGIHIGPLFVHLYGLMYVFAVAGAILVSSRRWRKAGGDPNLPYEVALWAFPAGLIGGRIYFLITTPSQVPDHWWGPFAIWQGGLGIWGGIAGGVLVGLWVVRRRLSKPDVRRFMDAAAPGLLVAQSLGRVGNYFNQELFGKPSTLPWALKISPSHRPSGYAQYATFQPTFLYEIIWNLSLAGFLVWLGHHRKVRPPGLFALYVAGYSAFRLFEEQLRIDYSVHVLGMRLNFWIALALFLIGVTWFIAAQRGVRWEQIRARAGFAPAIGASGADGRAPAPSAKAARKSLAAPRPPARGRRAGRRPRTPD